MHRPSLRIVPLAVLLVALTASGLQAASTPPSDWPQPDADAAHSRANLNERALSPTTALSAVFDLAIALPPNPDPLNEFDLCQPQVHPTPAVTATRFFTAYGNAVAQFDLATGARLWRQQVRQIPEREATHLVLSYGSRVYAAMTDCSSESDPTMRLDAYDAATGQRLWEQRGFVGWSDVVAAGQRLVMSGYTVYGNSVNVLDAATGTTVWSRTDPLSCTANALVVRRSVIMAVCDEERFALQARRLSDGALLWSRTGAWTPERGDRAGYDGQLVMAVSPSGRLTALDAATGATRWSTSLASQSLAVDNYRVYARCGDAVCALSRGNGALLWTGPAVPGDVVVANGVLYLANGQVMRASTGAVLGRLWDDDHRLLAVAGGRVVASDADQRVFDLYAVPQG